MSRSIVVVSVLLALTLAAGPQEFAQSDPAPAGRVVATLELSQQFYYAGEPLMVRVIVGNDGDQKVTNPVKSPLLKSFKVLDQEGKALESRGDTEAQEPTRPKDLTPRSFYGAVVDLVQIFPELKSVGDYEITWSADGVTSQTLTVKMLPKYDASKEYRATIEMDGGNIVIDFHQENAPIAVKAFIDMANAGFYDGLLFHEVRYDWFIAGGDPQYGDSPRIPFIYPAEQSFLPIVAGSLVMKPVRPSPPANGSQFIILARPEPSWTGQVTVVGQVVQGMNVVRNISRAQSTFQSSRPYFKPLKDIRIRKVTISEKPAQATAAK